MRKFILVLVLCALCFPVFAADSLSIGETLQKLPAIKNGGYYSLIDSEFNYSATVALMEYKGFTLNGGYAGRAEQTKDKLILSVSYDLLKLKDYISIPILDLIVIEPYLCAGLGSINVKELPDFKYEGDLRGSEFDCGIGANILQVKF